VHGNEDVPRNESFPVGNIAAVGYLSLMVIFCGIFMILDACRLPNYDEEGHRFEPVCNSVSILKS
jgi:hypothetical protein